MFKITLKLTILILICSLCLTSVVQGYIKGDLNKDGVVDDADIAALEQILVEADINEDGIVSDEDVEALTAIIHPPGPDDLIKVDCQVAAGLDDCYTFGTTIRLNRKYLFIDECSNYMHAYMRFTDVDIPPGAVITHAYIDLCSYGHFYGDSHLSIYGIKEPNTNSFSSQADADSRMVTDTYVDWTMYYYDNAVWDKGSWYGATNNPQDIRDVIQEIVDQEGWEDGNPLAIKIINRVHQSNSKLIYSWEYGDHSLAAKLHIEYLAK